MAIIPAPSFSLYYMFVFDMPGFTSQADSIKQVRTSARKTRLAVAYGKQSLCSVNHFIWNYVVTSTWEATNIFCYNRLSFFTDKNFSAAPDIFHISFI